MTTDELLEIIEARGLRVICEAGKLCLRGDRGQATPKLMRALALHKAELLARYGSAPPEPEPEKQPEPEPEPEAEVPQAEEPQECGRLPWWISYLWGTGHVRVRHIDDPIPGAAWWWRLACGQDDWQRLPDCPPGQHPPEIVDG